MAGYERHTLNRAKIMRREPTEAETALWRALRNGALSGAKFRRQQPIGPYIADFVCQSHRLVVEADGSQHAESAGDEKRDAFLRSAGYRVLRFWNNDILNNISGVADAIVTELHTPHPPIAAQWAPPSPSRGEGFQKDLPSG
jgi:very-short-patch-repair endonuclease